MPQTSTTSSDVGKTDTHKNVATGILMGSREKTLKVAANNSRIKVGFVPRRRTPRWRNR